jgi:hypothetical protein
MRVWNEVPTRRTQELVVDGATLIWVVVWVWIGISLYGALASLSTVGTSLGDAGAGLADAGTTIRVGLSQVPLVGAGVGELVGGALDAVATPLVDAGAGLEELLLTVATILALLVVAIALVPWLNRYLPWRRRRWRRLNAGDQAIRHGSTPAPDLERILATRAITRLEYADLLEHTPDPIGDFAAGRYDRLARAELTSVGLARLAVGPG